MVIDFHKSYIQRNNQAKKEHVRTYMYEHPKTHCTTTITLVIVRHPSLLVWYLVGPPSLQLSFILPSAHSYHPTSKAPSLFMLFRVGRSPSLIPKSKLSQSLCTAIGELYFARIFVDVLGFIDILTVACSIWQLWQRTWQRLKEQQVLN